MKRIPTVAARELSSLFVSPVAYVVLTLYALLAGAFFLMAVIGFVERLRQFQAMQAFEYLQQWNLNDYVVAPYLETMTVVLIFLVPGITMGVFSSEKANGTDELLLTSPLSIWDVVLGKYLATVIFVLLLGAVTAFFPAILFLYGDPETGKTLAGILGLLLSGFLFAAVGCLASAITRSQIIAFIVAFVVLFLLMLVGSLAQGGGMGGGVLSSVLAYVSVGEHIAALMGGLVDTADLAYFAALIAISLIITKTAVESVRWR